MIVKPETMTFDEKKIRMLVAGFPGIGKTTLALSAPSPLYIDVDLSAERINREILNLAAGVTQPKDYEELRRDLGMGCSDMELHTVKNSLADYQTIIVDTGGKLLNIMSNYGRKIEPKYGQRDGSLSLKGYGWLGKEFQRFLDHIIYELDKHIVIVFHTVEDKDGDDTKLRIKAEGSSKNNVWEVMDLGGFMEMRGNNRTIGFSNCERYFAKGTRGIHGVLQIPDLTAGTPNDFLTNPFEDMTTERDPLAEFVATLNKVPTPPNEAMANGIAFEDLVTAITQGRGDPKDRWYDAASKVAQIVGGGVLQYRASKTIEVGGLTLVLYGRLDCLKSGEIYDIKFSKGYDRGKYTDSTQHPTYLELVPEARGFTYIVSNGNEVWTERYRRDETPAIIPTISDFLDWMQAMGFLDTYKEKWLGK